ncbi:MAG TPA: exodeoxyribonuclease VII large subunit [Acidobacteriaceae bacterium]|nr:exodeoxyribonuclease VII large subunit [Acidobacteriaceae bacterium]
MAAKDGGDGRQGTLAGLWLPQSRSRKPSPTPATQQPIAEAQPITPGTASAPWTVSALVAGVRRHVEGEYQDVWVAGEISNCRPAPSGHLYFTLKDGDAQLPVVLFRRQSILLRFRPQDGMAVLARGRVSVYESRGQLQLIAEQLEPRGAGALQLAFEQLKARLLAEGLFDSARRRTLPPFPRCIGIVTSTAGAVLHDIVKIVRRRHACLHLLVYPATMQGPACASSVIDAIRWFNRTPHQVDVILIARGGGSIEDLAGFNDEALARTIAASTLPIVSAIGHETDFTIADFVADLRAPTPSAAAELITAAQHRIEERIQALDARIHRAIRYQLMLSRQRLTAVSTAAMRGRILAFINRRSQRLDDLRRRIESAMVRRLRTRSNRIAALTERIERQNPSLRLTLARRRLDRAEHRLEQLTISIVGAPRNRLERTAARLIALSPLAVLSRGYAIVYTEDGRLLRNSATAQRGQKIRARLAQGSLTARVESTDPT